MIIFLSAIFGVGLIGHFFVYQVLLSLARGNDNDIDDICVKYCWRPINWILVFIVLRLGLGLKVPEEYFHFTQQLISIGFVILVSILLVKILSVFQEYVTNKFDIETADNLQARKVHTQLNVVKRIAIVLISILALAMILMTFEKVRQLGTTILASAGIIGIVVGMAAQKTIGTFIAGLQIAFTQPIRIDDVVIVEGEWGRIEEITLTYVVVKIWDLRRLIVPITYFIENPFQNWTRVTADILGSVFIYVDYTVDVDRIRQKLQSVLEGSEYWDKKVCVLQVTNTTEKTIELRALMSAKDASTAWNLRCNVREELVKFIQTEYPDALPKARVELEKQ